MNIHVYNINWDTTDEDGNIQDVALPNELTFVIDYGTGTFSYDELVERITDKLSDYFGFCINSLDVEFEFNN